MNCLRSILLHLDASPASLERLVFAQLLAEREEAGVTVLYACDPTRLGLTETMFDDVADTLPAARRLDGALRDRARAHFDRTASALPRAFAWSELRAGPPVPGFVRQALFFDLLVLGQHGGDLAAPGVPVDFVPAVLMESGRPGLVLPATGLGPSVGRAPLIAWKPTREAARALSAALPFLQRAERIHLAVAEAPGDDAAGQADRLADFLRTHGVDAPVLRHPAVPSEEAGGGLLALADDTGADLLVMGCYGRSPSRERVLGGATRTILMSATLAVLMAH